MLNKALLSRSAPTQYYLMAEALDGLYFYDYNVLTSTLNGTAENSSNTLIGSSARYSFVDNNSNNLFVVRGVTENTVRSIDISDPTAPVDNDSIAITGDSSSNGWYGYDDLDQKFWFMRDISSTYNIGYVDTSDPSALVVTQIGTGTFTPTVNPSEFYGSGLVDPVNSLLFGCDGTSVEIIDIASPSTPAQESTLNLVTASSLTDHTFYLGGVDKVNAILFCLAYEPVSNFLRWASFDYSDPTNPVFVDARNIDSEDPSPPDTTQLIVDEKNNRLFISNNRNDSFMQTWEYANDGTFVAESSGVIFAANAVEGMSYDPGNDLLFVQAGTLFVIDVSDNSSPTEIENVNLAATGTDFMRGLTTSGPHIQW